MNKKYFVFIFNNGFNPKLAKGMPLLDCFAQLMTNPGMVSLKEFDTLEEAFTGTSTLINVTIRVFVIKSSGII